MIVLIFSNNLNRYFLFINILKTAGRRK